jgi:hypothetical protein
MAKYMRWKPKMTPSTLNAILNSAPMVIQGASKLIRLIKEQGISKPDEDVDKLLSVENLKTDIQRLESRLAATDESNIEQIKLIEQLAQQNEVLAVTMSKGFRRLNLMTFIAGLASLIAICALVLVLFK